jgi:AraC-like DNA-binding protein
MNSSSIKNSSKWNMLVKNEPMPSPVVMVNEEYDDAESFGRGAGWDIDFRQLEQGPLRASVLSFGHPEIMVLRVKFNRSFHQLGHPPAGYRTFGFPDVESGVLRWKCAEIKPGVLINFNFEEMLDSVNPPGQFSGFVLCFSGFGADLFEEIQRHQFWDPAGVQHDRLREILKSLVMVATQEGDEGLKRWHKVFNYDLPRSLLSIIAGESSQAKLTIPKFRAAALNRALEVLSSYEQMPVSVEALCKLSGSSWATLQRAFKDEFQVTPKAYMKSRRLAAVQTELIRQGPTAVISDIANHWGFWHLGSFASDYKKQFGELPSQTLLRL